MTYDTYLSDCSLFMVEAAPSTANMMTTAALSTIFKTIKDFCRGSRRHVCYNNIVAVICCVVNYLLILWMEIHNPLHSCYFSGCYEGCCHGIFLSVCVYANIRRSTTQSLEQTLPSFKVHVKSMNSGQSRPSSSSNSRGRSH